MVAHAVRHKLSHITVEDSAGAADYRLLGSDDDEDLRLVALWDEKGDRLRNASDRENDRRLEKAGALMEAGQYARAREILHQVAWDSKRTVNTASMFESGECSEKLGEHWRAAAELSAATVWEDRSAAGETLCNLGVILHGLRYHAFALRCYDQALAIKDDIVNRGNRGELFLDMGEAKRGLDDLKRALAMDPDDSNIREQYERACKMLKIAPRFPKSRKKWGRS